MNRPQLYQVYVQHEGKERRFHMQADDQGKFRIMGEQICPPTFTHLESTFIDAIKKLGGVN